MTKKPCRCNRSILGVVQRFWECVYKDTPFNKVEFAERLRRWYGHDGHRLSAVDVLMALEEREEAPWRDIGWGAKELFCGAAELDEFDDHVYLDTVSGICLYAGAVKRGHFGWSMPLACITEFVHITYTKHEKDFDSEIVCLYSLMFSCPH